MARKPLSIPPEAAQAFMRDLKRYNSTRNKDKQTLCVARQAEALSRATGTKVTMEEVRQMFRRVRSY